MVLEITK
jgi:hypothetical protein